KVGTEMKLPFELTTRRIKGGMPGKFEHPPRGTKEEDFQKYFIQECSALKKISFVVYDTSKRPLLETRKPDFVFVHRDHSLDPLNVAIVGEIRIRNGNQFGSADIGHCISFAEKVLQLQPRRAFIYAILTDCYVIVVYKVSREGDGRFSYSFTTPEKLQYDQTVPPVGWKYLLTMLSQSL